MISHLLADADYPDELTNLYNPGYTAAVVLLMGSAYQDASKAPFPLVYSYLGVTLVAIEDCRLRLPAKAVGRVADWVHQNFDVLMNVPRQTVALKPFVNSGLVLLGSRHLLSIDDRGCHFKNHMGIQKKLTTVRLRSQAVEDELGAASLVGRWLAREQDVSAVLAFLGVKP